MNRKIENVKGISTGFDKLNEMTSGMQDSDIVIIAGRPAMGKTAFALSMAKIIAADKRIPMAYFSLEISNVQLLNRLLSNVCEIEGRKILNGKLNREDWENLDKNMNTLLDAPLYIDDTEGLTVQELRSKACRLVREKGIKLIMIDYLQLMTACDMKYNSRREKKSFIIRSLKDLAKELNIPILVLYQMSRGMELLKKPEVRRPELSDLQDYDTIELSADIVVFLHRPEYRGLDEIKDETKDNRERTEVIIAKNHRGETGIIQMDFKGEYSRFDNPIV